jgi:hypothetical protein
MVCRSWLCPTTTAWQPSDQEDGDHQLRSLLAMRNPLLLVHLIICGTHPAEIITIYPIGTKQHEVRDAMALEMKESHQSRRKRRTYKINIFAFGI